MVEKKEQQGLKYKKSQFSEWFSEVLNKAELIDLRYNVKGFVVFRPWAAIAMKEMYSLYEKELEKKKHVPAIFPALIPEQNLTREAAHVEGFSPEVFWIDHVGEGTKLTERLALRPTSETAMYTMYALWVRSWRDLPLKIYQSCQVWRHETKATRPLIRGREFYWIEAHDVFETEKESRQQVEEDMETTKLVLYKEYGIPFIGFQRPEWDKFPGAVHTYAADCLMPDGKIIQQPSTHLLGQNFAKSFGIVFVDKKGKEVHPWQTCYGPAISRMLASVIATHGDDKGLMFPFKIAPVQVIIIPINENRQVLKKCGEIESSLLENGIRAKVDDSPNTPGWKFNNWEMRGVPIRLEIGPREVKNKKVTLNVRDTKDKIIVLESKLLKEILDQGTSFTKHLIKRADDAFKGNVHNALTKEELKETLKKGGFTRINFCTMEKAGEACAEKLKDEFSADVRGTWFGKKEKAKGKCLACGKKAKAVVYVGKQY